MCVYDLCTLEVHQGRRLMERKLTFSYLSGKSQTMTSHSESLLAETFEKLERKEGLPARCKYLQDGISLCGCLPVRSLSSNTIHVSLSFLRAGPANHWFSTQRLTLSILGSTSERSKIEIFPCELIHPSEASAVKHIEECSQRVHQLCNRNSTDVLVTIFPLLLVETIQDYAGIDIEINWSVYYQYFAPRIESLSSFCKIQPMCSLEGQTYSVEIDSEQRYLATTNLHYSVARNQIIVWKSNPSYKLPSQSGSSDALWTFPGPYFRFFVQ